jgi:hypothetical protein
MSRATLVLHGERAGGRPVGSPTILPLPGPDLYSNEPGIAEAKLARLVLLSGAWRTAPKTGGPDAKGDYLLGLKAPAAMLFPPAARHALLRRPPAKGCHWCVARMLAALDSQPDPTPSDPLRAFLGKPCGRCELQQAMNARIAQVRAEFAAEVAAGLPPARPCRACGGRHRWAPSPRPERPAQAPRGAPTGILWPAGQRPPQAALRAAALPRPARPARPGRGLRGMTAEDLQRAAGRQPPAYYRRRPWPDERRPVL